MSLEIPPLSSIPQTILVDPADKRRGEKLITKTFFSYGPGAEGDDQAVPFLSIKERKVVSSFFREKPDGNFEKSQNSSEDLFG